MPSLWINKKGNYYEITYFITLDLIYGLNLYLNQSNPGEPINFINQIIIIWLIKYTVSSSYEVILRIEFCEVYHS